LRARPVGRGAVTLAARLLLLLGARGLARAPQLLWAGAPWRASSGRRGRASAAATAVVGGHQDALLAAIDAKVKEFERKYVVDEAAAMQRSTFPVDPAELVKSAKVFLAYEQGVSAPQLLAEDFQFKGPVVGPLDKEEYLAAVGSFDLASAFPDATPEWHHFRVDPFEPNRVWMTARGKGTNSGRASDSPLFAEPTGLSYVSPPQACSVTFNDKGQVRQYTIGHVMDRSVGNTGGLGGIYGILYAIGRPLPFPEARPWKMSRRYWLFQKAGRLLQRLRR